MIWFAIGAAVMVVQHFIRQGQMRVLAQMQRSWAGLIAGTAVAALIGAATYGLVLWLIFGLLLG